MGRYKRSRRCQARACHTVQIHWFSIINSCVTVLLLTGFLATILMRVLKNDFVKYSRDDEGEQGAVLRANHCESSISVLLCACLAGCH